MTERKRLENKVKKHKAKIKSLQSEIADIEKQLLLLCDSEQWFTEEEEDVIISKRPKLVEKKLVGRIHWNEDFVDEDTGEVVSIERGQIVSLDGNFNF